MGILDKCDWCRKETGDLQWVSDLTESGEGDMLCEECRSPTAWKQEDSKSREKDWYTADEIDWKLRNDFGIEQTELATWIANGFQKAYEKGQQHDSLEIKQCPECGHEWVDEANIELRQGECLECGQTVMVFASEGDIYCQDCSPVGDDKLNQSANKDSADG